jgi:hypothetical protein
MKQRCQHSLKLRGEKSQLTDEREAKLNAIGFSWVAPGFSKKTVQMPGDEEAQHEVEAQAAAHAAQQQAEAAALAAASAAAAAEVDLVGVPHVHHHHHPEEYATTWTV